MKHPFIQTLAAVVVGVALFSILDAKVFKGKLSGKA